MITWHIYINNIEVDEPQGWADVVLNISRDEQWHGIFFEASNSTLIFTGTGADLLKAEKDSNGLASAATFRAEAECGEIIDILEGNFDFGTYVEKCGNSCTVEIAIEKSGCIMAMRNRYDQKVDLQKATSFGGNLLTPYPGLDFSLELLAQNIAIGDEADVKDSAVSEIISNNVNWVDSDGFNNYIGYIAPPLPNVTNSSFGVFNASPIIDLAGPTAGVPNRPPYPDFPTAIGTATLIGTLACGLEDVELKFRLIGDADATFSGAGSVSCNTKVFRLPVGLDGTVAINWIQEYTSLLFSRTTTGVTNFDTGDVVVPLTINQGDFIYFGLSTRGQSLPNIDNFTLTFEVGTYFKLLAAAACEPSDADVSLVNEVGSRIVESITDNCLQMKSDYYGRTDSKPYTSLADGCGALRVLSNGLKIRNAATSNHFMSLQDFYTGLRGIDNIGMGIEVNSLTGLTDWLRVEPVEYFYQDVRLLTLPYIPAAEFRQNARYGFSKIQIGYPKWEVERVNGLNEFNSTKEFRTSLKTIDNTLDAQSNFVAGGIPIEVTRQQSFADSGAADTRYDNDTFIICVDRTGYSWVVERGNIGNNANIFSPATAYNWRIRPMSNLMRWFKSIGQSYVNLYNTLSKLFFSEGKGNYIAEGELLDPDACKLEAGVLAENHDLRIQDFADPTDAIPIYSPDDISFEYPLSIADYILIKANPYGYIYIQCGSGDYVKAYIKTIVYSPTKGTAQFTLIKKWEQ